VELSLTPAGRRLAKRVTDTRRALFDAGRGQLSQKQLDAALALFRELLKDSPLGGLIERRRELE
jgi:hypothetical protein